MSKKKTQKPVKIFTLDTETRGLFGEITRVGLYDGSRYYVGNSVKDIKPTLHKFTTKYDCHVFIHNLDFDLAKMASELIPNSNLQKSIFINNNVTVFQANITETQSSEENDIISNSVTFHDSNKIVMGRLKKICKDFNLDVEESKIDLKQHILNLGWGRNANGEPITHESEYDEFESEGYYFMHVDPFEKQFNEYLRLDCISLYKVVQTLIDISGLNVHEFLKCPTTASLAMRVFKINYEKDYKDACSTNYYGTQGKINELFVREAYCGGRTEVFVPFIENAWHYDVNSLYPYTMKTFEIPYGTPTMYYGDEAREIFKYWYNFNQGAGFIKCDVTVPDHLFIPPLPLKRMNKLIFPTGNIKGVWTFEEIKLALEMGCKIRKTHTVLYFDKKRHIFKNFIEHFEEMKTTSTGAKRFFAKTVQNSLYGKFGMKRVRKSLLGYEALEQCENALKRDGLRYVVLENPLIEGEKFIEAEILSRADYIQPHIAAYITSYARIVLYKGLMSQLEKGVVSYCDTDSIVSQYEMNQEQIDDNEYGKWKLEYHVEEGLFLQPKTYYEKTGNGDIELKFKGIPKNKMKEITPQTYFDILDALKEIQIKLENGEHLTKEETYFPLYKTPDKKRIKFATTLKTGDTDFDKHVEIMKGVNLANIQKREMDYVNNTSRPHHLIEF